MPQLSDIAGKRVTKKFTKREYRPWDLSGTGTSLLNTDTQTENKNQLNPVNTESQDHLLYSEKSPFEIDNKLDNDSGNTKTTNEKRLVNNEITDRKQIDNIQTTVSKHISNVIDNDLDNENHNEEYIEKIRNLTGIQEKMFFYIIDVCSARGHLDTGHLLTSDLATIANCSIKSAKTSLERLVLKKLVIRKKGKTSKGGYLLLNIPKDIQTAAVQAKRFLPTLIAYANTNSSYLDNNRGNSLVNNVASSSINNINNTTTVLPEEWLEIDFSSLKHIGFSQAQLLQLYSKQLNTPQIIQESINHFAFGLEKNPKVKAYPDPLNVLIGVLRKGLSWVEPNYISQKERTLSELLQLKKLEAERVAILERNLLEEEYKLWIHKISDVEKQQILSSVPKANIMSKGMTEKVNEGFLLQYFKDNIYNKSF